MFVADNMARIVDYVFGMPAGSLTGLEIFLGICAFAFQIYGDFSGYSDIARGTAKCLGFEIMVNFKRPYFALNPSDFWQRWHVSLSSWLRDYLYISLGGNRRGKLNTYRNLALTMLLGGLWHGAGWTFIAWGAFHGLILILYRLGGKKEKAPAPVERTSGLVRRISFAYRWVIMLFLVLISWLLFRAQSMHQVGIMFVQMFSSWKITPMALLFIKNIVFFSWFLVLVDTWDFMHEGETNAPRLGFFVKFTFYLYCISSILFFGMFEAQQFIYFQF
jgi:D-alanyl-lipoteichoic acid acyltransferase DltB (MBOAT superfamily)